MESPVELDDELMQEDVSAGNSVDEDVQQDDDDADDTDTYSEEGMDDNSEEPSEIDHGADDNDASGNDLDLPPKLVIATDLQGATGKLVFRYKLFCELTDIVCM